MTTPEPRPASAALSQRAPVDSSWPAQHIEPYRRQLVQRLDDVERRLDDATQRHDDAADQGRGKIDELRAKVPDVGDNPSEVEWLTRRAAQADADLAASQHEAALMDLWVQRQTLSVELHDLASRIAQVDDLLETGVYAAGNAALREVIKLDVLETAADFANATAILDIARQRVVHVKRMHREIHTALRKARLSAESARKR